MPPTPDEAEAANSPAAAASAEAAADAASETTPLAAATDGVDPVKVKFVAGGGDDAKLEMGGGAGDPEVAVKGGSGEESEFRAMTKAELMKYAKDPFWVAVRWALFVLFWIAWVAMLVAAVVIIVYAPKCPTPAPKQWWQKKPIYQVYVQSFKDSNSDGKGDLKGVESKLDYLKDLGVGTVALSPFFPSPMVDNGYDITDFKDVHTEYGTVKDFKSLLEGAHDRDLKVVIDFVPNHSSDQHEWFKKSVAQEEPYKDFYVWQDPATDGGPPTNWKAVLTGGSAWVKDNTRGQYYLAQFMPEMPDLNLRNPAVKDHLKDVLKFWLDLGVDGFRVDSVAHFLEDNRFQDETVIPEGKDYNSVDHSKTFDLDGNKDILKEFRSVLDAKTKEDESKPRIMMTEAYLSVEELNKYYGDVKDQIGSISQMPINFGLVEMSVAAGGGGADFAKNLFEKIETYTGSLPNVTEADDDSSNLVKTGALALTKAWSNFNTGNHDNSRLASRLTSELIDGFNMLVMLMQGTPITYYGDEIGMVDGSSKRTYREGYRTPMQWTGEAQAGFTDASATPWLPVNSDKDKVNVEAQSAAAGGSSHLQVFKALAELRDSEAVLFGETELWHEGDVIGYTRVKKGNPGIVVLVNFGDVAVEGIDVSTKNNVGGDDAKGNLFLRSSQYFNQQDVDQSVNMKAIKLEPKEGKVIKFVPKF